MVDALKNFAYSLVATAPSPATSGTSLVVTSGQGTLFPAVPFDATVWPAGSQPTSTNAEIVRVTAVSTDTFTITRAQYGTTAQSIAIGYQIAQTIDANLLSQIIGAGPSNQTSSFTAAAGGQYVLTGSTASQTATLPSSTAVTGPPIDVTNNASVTWTVAAGSGTTLNVNGTTGSLTLQPGTSITLILVGTVWYATDVGLISLATNSGVLGANQAVPASWGTLMTTGSLGIGTWLVNVTANAISEAAFYGMAVGIRLVVGTATATFSGPRTSELETYSAGLDDSEGTLSFCCIVTVTVAGTLIVQSQESLSGNWQIGASTNGFATANATGWTAVRIA